MLSKYEGGGFYIGNYVQHNCPAFVDGNKFFQRHSCIVGNTGSGKSETVAKILEESAKLSGTNIIVFDIHGEYGKLSLIHICSGGLCGGTSDAWCTAGIACQGEKALFGKWFEETVEKNMEKSREENLPGKIQETKWLFKIEEKKDEKKK